MNYLWRYVLALFLAAATLSLQAQCGAGMEEVIVRVETNGAWTQLGWVLEDANTGTLYLDWSKLPSNTSNQLFEDTLCIPTGTDLQYRVFDGKGYGLCCEYGDGFFEVLVNGQRLVWQEGFLRPEQKIDFHVPLPATDLAMRELFSYDSVATGLHWMRGLVHNTGQQPITEYTLNWSVNGLAPHRQTYSGVSIPAGEAMQWEHAVGLPADTAGVYQVKVWLSGVNGDAIASNDSLQHQITAIILNRNVLLETRTNFYCGPCGDWMPLLGERLRDNQQYAFGLMMHSDGWSANDLIYKDYPEQNLRLDAVYPGNVHPYSFVNGKSYTGSRFVTRNLFWEEAKKPRIFHIALPQVQLDTQSQVLSFQSMVYADQAYTSSNLRLHQIIIEEYISLPLQPNGEDHAEWVMKKMLPDYIGTALPVNVMAGDSFPAQGSWNLQKVYDARQLGVLIFVQDMNTREVLQVNYAAVHQPDRPSGGATRLEPLSERLNLRLGPVPTEDFVELRFDLVKQDQLRVEVLDLRGKKVLSLETGRLAKGPHHFRLDLQHLPQGTYLLNLGSTAQGYLTRKLVKQ